jgi:hypothetical protein
MEVRPKQGDLARPGLDVSAHHAASVVDAMRERAHRSLRLSKLGQRALCVPDHGHQTTRRGVSRTGDLAGVVDRSGFGLEAKGG